MKIRRKLFLEVQTNLLSCPATKQVLGGAVFDLEGWLVGIIISMDDSSYRLKFALQACHWVDKLEDILKGLDEKVNIL